MLYWDLAAGIAQREAVESAGTRAEKMHGGRVPPPMRVNCLAVALLSGRLGVRRVPPVALLANPLSTAAGRCQASPAAEGLERPT